MKVVAEVVKVEEAALLPSTPSLTPRIQLGKASGSKASTKTALKVKLDQIAIAINFSFDNFCFGGRTLLPVRKSLPQKSVEPKAELRKCLEMPVLKKALMTPPMNSSTPVTHRQANFYKDDKPLKCKSTIMFETEL